MPWVRLNLVSGLEALKEVRADFVEARITLQGIYLTGAL